MTTVTLDKLAFDLEHNSRQGMDDEAMAELMRSIHTNGLITPLTVRSTDHGTFLVIDGHRRLEALNRLFGAEKESTHVPVLVRNVDDKDARALSLAANIVRLPLHPADQYQAFAAMLDEGMEREEIAARFNLALKDVERVLALGRVIPAILDLYRKGDIDADTVKLFASCSEDRQRDVWRKAYEDESLSRWQVHRLLSDNTLNQNSPVVKLVSEQDYETAGGRVERSLFGEEVRWLDVDLAMKLARYAIAEKVAVIREEGWAFVSHEADMPKQWRNWSRVYPEPTFTDEQWASLEEIDKRFDELSEISGKDWTDENEEEQERLDTEQGEIRGQAVKAFTPEVMASAGVVICEDFTIIAGVKKPEKVAQPTQAEEGDAEEKEEPWPQSLKDDLHAVATDAIQVAVSKGSHVDQVAFFCASVLCTGITPSSLSTRNGFTYQSPQKQTQVQQAIDLQLGNMGIEETHDFWQLLNRIQGSGADNVLELFSLCLASSVQKVHREEEAKAFKAAFGATDVAAIFTPDEMFFNRLKMPQINEVIREMGQRPMKDGLKKKESVQYAAGWAAKTGWLPKFLRALAAPKPETVTELKPVAKKAQPRKKAA